tara:strand:- start:5897 stop:6571 length:675 start_codon:yes stop_codon:yes gene_type:complete
MSTSIRKDTKEYVFKNPQDNIFSSKNGSSKFCIGLTNPNNMPGQIYSRPMCLFKEPEVSNNKKKVEFDLVASEAMGCPTPNNNNDPDKDFRSIIDCVEDQKYYEEILQQYKTTKKILDAKTKELSSICDKGTTIYSKYQKYKEFIDHRTNCSVQLNKAHPGFVFPSTKKVDIIKKEITSMKQQLISLDNQKVQLDEIINGVKLHVDAYVEAMNQLLMAHKALQT